MGSKKSINSHEMKEDKSLDYLWGNYFLWQFFNNFSVLLCKIFF